MNKLAPSSLRQLRELRQPYICQSCTAFQRSQRKRFASASSVPKIYDVVCVGGGPAGLTLLNALRSSEKTSRLKVALVESQDLDRVQRWQLPPDLFSNRVSSLTPSSVNFLREIGAWDYVQESRVQPYQEMQVWDGVSGSRISFDWTSDRTSPQASSQETTIAYMTENLNLVSALLGRLKSLGSVSVFDKTRVKDITLGTENETLNLSSWPIVHLENGQSMAARLLVGADGGNSPVRTFAGIESKGWDYGRHGVVATVELEQSWKSTDTKTAYQRFLPTGPVALLPLPGDFATLVWSTTPEYAALLKTLSAPDLSAMINAAFRLQPVDIAYLHQLSSGQVDEVSWRENHTLCDNRVLPQRVRSVQDGTLASFPLKMRHADTYIGSRVALVGDAAHTIHPLAGQGLNQGQGDIQSLTRTLEFAVEHGQDIGDPLTLDSYNAGRYAVNNTLLSVVDKLHKLYSVQSGPLVPLRSLGLSAVNSMGPLKAFFMRQAAGA